MRYATLVDALHEASRGGRCPLLIKGDDGIRMKRRYIINAVRVGEREGEGR